MDNRTSRRPRSSWMRRRHARERLTESYLVLAPDDCPNVIGEPSDQRAHVSYANACFWSGWQNIMNAAALFATFAEEAEEGIP
jgi:hypothetical protein